MITISLVLLMEFILIIYLVILMVVYQMNVRYKETHLIVQCPNMLLIVVV